jgi:hypothetical protein
MLQLRWDMPEISRFYSIIIRMFFSDHPPPHLHANYQKSQATFSITTGQMIDGKFPKKQTAFVTAWILMHQKELMDNWKALIEGKDAKKIAPLR